MGTLSVEQHAKAMGALEAEQGRANAREEEGIAALKARIGSLVVKPLWSNPPPSSLLQRHASATPATSIE